MVGRGEYQFDFALLQHPGCSVAHTGFESGVCQRLKSEGGFLEMRCLFGISYVKLYIIGTLKRQKIGSCR